MAKVQRLVRVGRRVFDNDGMAVGRRRVVGAYRPREFGLPFRFKRFHPVAGAQAQVKETFDHVELLHERATFAQGFAYGLGRFFRAFARRFDKRKDHEREVALEFAFGLLERNRFGLGFQRKQAVCDIRHGGAQGLFDRCHNAYNSTHKNNENSRYFVDKIVSLHLMLQDRMRLN